MISCTEFIPLYSELFKFLEKAGGYEARSSNFAAGVAEKIIADSVKLTKSLKE